VALLIASNLRKDMAGRPLLDGVSFKLEPRERLTIAGRNGAGKTTLLRILAGEESFDGGELTVAKGVRVALHDQRPPRHRDTSLRDYVLSGCVEELDIERRLAAMEQQMATGATDEALLERYARAQAHLESRGGYLWRDRATVTTRGLGFSEADLSRPLATFSGGQLTRASLARALATNADVLLLDEPTNHLDIESLEWLEQTLVALDAAVMLVAHDRWFLEAVGTAVLELHGGAGGAPSRSRFFAGTWHAWRREQAAREMALGKAIDKQRAEIERMERFVERFRYKATKARQAQSRLKKLAKIDRIERDAPEAAVLEFKFKPAARTGRVIFELQHGRIEVGDRSERAPGGGGPIVLLPDADLWLERGEHVVLVGPNGAGKTTLIDTLAARRPLAIGKLATGHNVTVGYLSQHAEELGAGGPPGQTVVEAAARATGLSPNKARALVGKFLFSGDDADKPLDGLSGGERRRLSLAILMNGTPHPPNVLILDEPTNHLDLESREALEDALRAFTGAILLVSHDRALLDAVGTRTIAIEDGSLHSHLGGWPEYVRIREERRAANAAAPRPSAGGGGAPAAADGRGGDGDGGGGDVGGDVGGDAGGDDGGGGDGGGGGEGRGAAAGRGVIAGGARGAGDISVGPPLARARARGSARGPSKNHLRAQSRAEQAVEQAEAALQALEQELSDPAAWATKYEAAKSEARHTAARRAVEDAYERLGELVD
jgi:ATP-binding cassette, subfamily F, member 3